MIIQGVLSKLRSSKYRDLSHGRGLELGFRFVMNIVLLNVYVKTRKEVWKVYLCGHRGGARGKYCKYESHSLRVRRKYKNVQRNGSASRLFTSY